MYGRPQHLLFTVAWCHVTYQRLAVRQGCHLFASATCKTLHLESGLDMATYNWQGSEIVVLLAQRMAPFVFRIPC